MLKEVQFIKCNAWQLCEFEFIITMENAKHLRGKRGKRKKEEKIK